MPQTKNIDMPTPANFDATLKAAGFRPSDIAGHYLLPLIWDRKQCAAIANWADMRVGFELREVSRATAMQCLVLYTENFS